MNRHGTTLGETVAILVGAFLIAAVLVGPFAWMGHKQAAKCEARGGVYTRVGCLKPECLQ